MAKQRAGIGNVVQKWTRSFVSMALNVFRTQSPEFKTLLYIVSFMTVAGSVMVFSSSYVSAVIQSSNPFGEVRTQIASAIIGWILLIVLANFQPSRIERLAKVGLGVGIFLQLLVLLTPLGKTVNGNRNWLNLGVATVQPSELLKIALIIFVAHVLSRPNPYQPEEIKFWSKPVYAFVAIAGVTIWGQDVGTVIIMALILFGMFYLGGLPWRYVQLLTVGALLAIPIAMFSSSSRRGRIMAWFNPDGPDPTGYNWQAMHGKWAFAAGGWFGTGLGNSKMKWSWLPEAQNDFIFAIIGEEWGLVGSLFTIALFVALGITMFKIARKTADQYQKLVVYGVTFWIMAQAFINISVVLTMFPVLGVNLPLISAGGTSMIATLIAIGIVLGIERSNSTKGNFTVVRGGRR